MSEYTYPKRLGQWCDSAAQVVLTARRVAGLTQKELAAKLGTSTSVISQYENGKVDPTVGTLRRIVEACGHKLRLFPDEPHPVRDDPDLPRRQARVREIMGLRAKAHAEFEKLYGKPRVMPGFQEAVLAEHHKYMKERGKKVAS